ncbi:MAG: hypothetical protein ACKVKM_08670, partial [Verrucomicrobiia bacterium]
TNPARGKAAGVGSIPTASTNFILFQMLKKQSPVGLAARLFLFIVIAAGGLMLPGCSSINKVNPVSDESYFQWLFALPHKAVKTVLGIHEE